MIELSGTTNDIARWIWQNLVPKQGQADSVQGELLRAVEKLRYEAQNNGNVNWDDRFEMFAEFLHQTLCSDAAVPMKTKEAITRDIERLINFLPPNQLKDRSQINELPYVEDDLYDRLTEQVVAFCRRHPQVIPRDKDPRQYR